MTFYKNSIVTDLLILLSVFYFSGPLFAQEDPEARLDKSFLSESKGEEGSQVNQEKSREIFGFLQSENFFHTRESGPVKESEIIKLESRARLNAKLGSQFFYAKASLDAYFFSGEQDNWAKAKSGFLEAQEIYIAGGDKLQFKLGKQLFNWGSADVFNVANFLDQFDLRELFAKDKDDRNRGVFSLSLKYIFKEFSLELALLPMHSPPLLPSVGSYWEIRPAAVELSVPMLLPTNQTVTLGSRLQPELLEPMMYANNLSNASGALRLGGTRQILDVHLSYFHGIDKSIIFQKEILLDFNNPLSPFISSMTLTPFYGKVDSLGLDLALNWEKFTLRMEAAYTPNKWASTKYDFQESPEGNTVLLNGRLERAPYMSYTTGFDVNAWGRDGRLLVEWTQGVYLRDRKNYDKEFLSNILIVRVEDKFFDKRLGLELGGMVRPVERKFGYVPMLDISWDFQNGLILKTGLVVFVGRDDSLIAPYDNHDYAYVKARLDY
jgi:hypothetical protein